MEHEITLSVEEIETTKDNDQSVIWTSDFVLCDQIEDEMTALALFYHTNCTVKDLMLISDYYGFAKDLRANKCNKEHIVDFLVSFETNPNNLEIVHRRRNMWFYVSEMQKDKFMKKYLLW